MFLQSIKLTNFKNHKATSLTFDNLINVFVGNNGSGKTNLLDAIFMVCYGKSYFSSREVHILNHESEFYRLEASIRQGAHPEKAIIKYDGQQKTITVDDVEISSLVEYLGRYPVAMISPGDIELIYGGSEVRRRFIDQVLSQSDRSYLDKLILYTRVLKQRNAFLKTHFSDKSAAILTSAWNQQLSDLGTFIHNKRTAFIDQFKTCFDLAYSAVAADRDKIDLEYTSALYNTDFKEGLLAHWEKDKILRRTTFGVHKDDLTLTKDGFPVSKEGSQGQIKSAVLALKLAQIVYLREQIHSNPILILDDIFDKLDPMRIRNLIAELVHTQQCQLFISDAFKTRLASILEEIAPGGYAIWGVEQGIVSPLKTEP